MRTKVNSKPVWIRFQKEIYLDRLFLLQIRNGGKIWIQWIHEVHQFQKIGSMISDIDSGTSQAHQEADKIMAAVVAVSAVVMILDYKFQVGIYNRLMRDSSIARLVTGILGFLVICLYGRDTPHRSFMHSFLAAGMLTACMDVIYPDAVPYFAVGILSHLALDLLNRRSVKLFWPWKKGYCMGLCSSRGWINHLCMLAGMAVPHESSR